MLRDLIKAFREDSLMNSILNEFSLMMEDARWMFERLGNSLVSGGHPEEYRQQIYDRDIRINKAERSIRKRIIEHLSLNPGKDLGSSLVLFSAAKDAERLGDYCKNLLEVAILLHGRSYPEALSGRIARMHGRISGLFTQAAMAFSQANSENAVAVMEEVRTISKECDGMVEEIMNGTDDQDAKSAVAATLTARFFKRVAGHISNIASGVVNPVHQIDYYPPNDNAARPSD